MGTIIEKAKRLQKNFFPCGDCKYFGETSQQALVLFASLLVLLTQYLQSPLGIHLNVPSAFAYLPLQGKVTLNPLTRRESFFRERVYQNHNNSLNSLWVTWDSNPELIG